MSRCRQTPAAGPRRLALSLMCLALAGCGSLVPPRESPDAALRADFRDSSEPSQTGAAAAHEWDGFFTDDRLRQVVGLALADNRSLRAGMAAVDRARAQYGVTRAAALPDVDATGSASRQRSASSSGSTSASTSSSYSVQWGLSSWEIDLFNRVGALEGAALARFLTQEETQRGARLVLVAEVANAWLNLAVEQQRLRLAQTLRDSQERSLALTERQYALGAVSGLQRSRAQAAFETARAEAARSAGALVQARLALELLAGRPLPAALLPGTGDESAMVLPDLPAGLPASVLLQRPDLRAAEQTLQAAAFDVGAARAARFPRLTLTASAGTRSTDIDGLFQRSSGIFSLAPSLVLPLFDGGERQALVAVTEASRRQALAQYEAALQSAFREVADALAVRDSLTERLAAQQALAKAAERSLALAGQAYRLGGASQLELLDAQRQFTTAQQGLLSLRQIEQANRVTLLRALGGRWTTGG
jgi:outer membrane protein, multidrug efflux system